MRLISHVTSDGGSPIQVLLIEDSPGDIELTRIAFEEAGFEVNLDALFDGSEALSYLRKAKGFEDARRPDLILLDLNLPRVPGMELLHEIKSDDALKRIPVVVFTSSTDESDVLGSYNRHANSYITKPTDFREFVNVVTSLDQYWGSVSRLPPH